MARTLAIALSADNHMITTGTGYYVAYNETNLTGNNNDLRFTDKEAGKNDRTVTYVDPGGTTAALAVTVDGSGNISVSLARAASAITSTAADIAAAIAAHSVASTLVTVTNKAANDGTGVVTAMAAMTLSVKTLDANIRLRVIGPDGGFVVTVDAIIDGSTGALSHDTDFDIDLENIGVTTVQAITSTGVILASDTAQVFSE